MKREFALDSYKLDGKTVVDEVLVAVNRFFSPVMWLTRLLNSHFGWAALVLVFALFVGHTWYTVTFGAEHAVRDLPTIYTIILLFALGFVGLILSLSQAYHARKMIRQIIENRSDEARYMAYEIAHEAESTREKMVRVVVPYHAKYCDYYQLLGSKVMHAKAVRSLMHSAENYDPDARLALQEFEELSQAYEAACSRIAEISSLEGDAQQLRTDLVRSGLQLGKAAKQLEDFAKKLKGMKGLKKSAEDTVTYCTGNS